MEIVDGPELCKKLRAAVKGSKRVRMAVAFWGDGIIKQLGLQDAKNMEIVCNLRKGGTNPAVIKAIANAGAKVRHSDNLHAKIYLTDEFGAIGSSNASSSGLCFQGDESTGWDEANVLFAPGILYDEAERMFNRLFEDAIEVTQPDLDRASDAWLNRRRVRPLSAVPHMSLFDALKKNPGSLADRRIYLCVFGNARSDESEEVLKGERERTGLGTKVDAFEDWDALPNDADLVTFYLGRRGGFRLDGLWHMPKLPREVKLTVGTLRFCDRLPNIAGYTDIGSLESWKKLVLRVRESSDYNEEEASALIEFGDLAHRYMNKQSSHTG